MKCRRAPSLLTFLICSAFFILSTATQPNTHTHAHTKATLCCMHKKKKKKKLLLVRGHSSDIVAGPWQPQRVVAWMGWYQQPLQVRFTSDPTIGWKEEETPAHLKRQPWHIQPVRRLAPERRSCPPSSTFVTAGLWCLRLLTPRRAWSMLRTSQSTTPMCLL